MADILLEWTDGDADVEEGRLQADVDTFVDQYRGVPLRELRMGAMLLDVSSLLRRNRLTLPPDLALMIKAFLTLEGLGRQLDPGFDMAAEAQPYLERTLRQSYSPLALARRGRRTLSGALDLVGSLPRDLRRLLQAARRGRLRAQIEITSLKAFGDQVNSAANRLTVGVITASLIIGSSIVMNSVGGGVSNRALMALGARLRRRGPERVIVFSIGAAAAAAFRPVLLRPILTAAYLVVLLLTMPLTDPQGDILALIAERIEDEGVPPSQAEIARAFGFSSVRAAQYHLEALEAAGAIERVPGRARGIRLLVAPESPQASLGLEPTDDSALRLPVLGQVAAGSPIGADAPQSLEADDYLILTACCFPSPDYLLKVKGDSMRDEGIFDGDLIGVHRTGDARSGQIVVARVDEEVTVKLLKLGRDRIRLLPRNPDHAPIEVLPDQDFAIEGLYCGLVRPNR